MKRWMCFIIFLVVLCLLLLLLLMFCVYLYQILSGEVPVVAVTMVIITLLL